MNWVTPFDTPKPSDQEDGMIYAIRMEPNIRYFIIRNCGTELVDLIIENGNRIIMERVWFVVKPLEEGDGDSVRVFWNAGSLENAIAWAKCYAETEGRDMFAIRKDLSQGKLDEIYSR